MFLDPVGWLGHVIFMVMVEMQKSKPNCTSTLPIPVNFVSAKSSHMINANIGGTGYYTPPMELHGESGCLPNTHVIV